MDDQFGPSWLAEAVEPLTSKFGRALRVYRDGNAVRWAFEGQVAIVELRPDGKMLATFMDRESVDAVSQRPAAAVYSARASYALTPASCSCMIADMVDFFCGVREPRFTFFDAYAR